MVDQIHLQMRAMQALSKSQDMTADNLANLNTQQTEYIKVIAHPIFPYLLSSQK